SIKSREYRKLISFVDQDTYLFNTSIRNNITLFSDVEDSHLYKAAQLCCVHEFIEKLPEKYESKTGRNGLLLSSGQKQKIAIARAFLRNSEILVFDEATSNCDADSESQINTIIKDNMEDKTVIIITHKPNILQIVDRVFLVQNGVIKETGSCKAASEVLETDYSGTRLRNDAV
ncbi:MAG: ATP-binding cassette domain-containing protein, partial [Caulobacteraceae bacterium]